MTSILMVCLGNICRSPLAEGILRSKSEGSNLGIEVDSCGTASYHVGEKPDPRSVLKANDYGIDISTLKARQFEMSDFDKFDFILTMDKYNQMDVLELAENELQRNKVRMILSYNQVGDIKDVPDPYYGGSQGFENVYHLLNDACDSFIQKELNE